MIRRSTGFVFSAGSAGFLNDLPEGAERVPQRRFTSWEGLRQHPLPNGGLKIGQHADEQGHGDAVPEGEAEEVAFLTPVMTGAEVLERLGALEPQSLFRVLD